MESLFEESPARAKALAKLIAGSLYTVFSASGFPLRKPAALRGSSIFRHLVVRARPASIRNSPPERRRRSIPERDDRNKPRGFGPATFASRAIFHTLPASLVLQRVRDRSDR